MTESCCCALYLAIHLLPTLVHTVQQYLHSELTEEFCQKHYEKFTFSMCFDTEFNAMKDVQEQNPCYLVTETTPLAANIEIKRKMQMVRYNLNISLLNAKNPLYICLNQQIIPAKDSKIATLAHNYTSLYKNLMLCFGTNKDNLLFNIVQQCGCSPDIKQYNCFWRRIHVKLLAWNLDIDFYSEIHR